MSEGPSIIANWYHLNGIWYGIFDGEKAEASSLEFLRDIIQTKLVEKHGDLVMIKLIQIRPPVEPTND